MGSGTWTLSSTGSVLNFPGTGLTINANTSTIVVSDTSATSKTLSGGGFTYNVVTISGDNVTISGACTIATLNINNCGLPTGFKLSELQYLHPY